MDLRKEDRSSNMDQNKKVTTLYLVRHGTTAWNQALRYQGQTDNPLDEIGERQGACLEEYFKDIHVDLGVTSPLQRAVKTLEYSLATQDHEVPVLVEPGIMEIDFGLIDGWTKEEIQAEYPEFYRMYVLNEDRGHARAPGGETMIEVYERVSKAIMSIVRVHRGETIVIASHGTAIQTFLNYAEGIPADKMGRYLLYNVSVCCVTVDEEDRTTLIFVDDKHHVPEELQFSYSSIPSK